MTALKYATAITTAFVLAACERHIPVENAFCVRTGERSFAIQTNALGGTTTLYSSENMLYDPVQNSFKGDVVTSDLVTPKAVEAYGFVANLNTNECRIRPNGFFDTYTNDFYKINFRICEKVSFKITFLSFYTLFKSQKERRFSCAISSYNVERTNPFFEVVYNLSHNLYGIWGRDVVEVPFSIP